MVRSNKKKFLDKDPGKDPPLKITPNSKDTIMVKRAIRSAQKHGIRLNAGRPNKADGNCAIEASVLNLNDRDCFVEKLTFSVDYYRRIWVTDMKNRTLQDETWKIYSTKEWEDGWADMMESGAYERGIFGDLMLLAIACGTKKFILIFNTPRLST